jgi:hypothetical protein
MGRVKIDGQYVIRRLDKGRRGLRDAQAALESLDGGLSPQMQAVVTQRLSETRDLVDRAGSLLAEKRGA